MLNRSDKAEIIKDLNQKFKHTSTLFVLDYKGLTVKDLETLRKDLRKVDGDLRIVKNTLIKKASENTDIDQINDLFVGPTAIAFCNQDFPPVAKIFVKTSKDFEQLKIRGGIVDGKIVDGSEIEQISKLPTRDELVTQFIGLLSSPMINVLGLLTQMQTKFLYALEALRQKKEEQEK